MFKILSHVFFVCVLVCCTGMGGTNKDLLTKIPAPDREFKVNIIDVEDARYTVSSFSVDGLTFLPVSLGKMLVSVDFADIDSLTLFLQDTDIVADIIYKAGQGKKVRLKKNLFFYGQSKWGKMKIYARDCRKIVFMR